MRLGLVWLALVACAHGNETFDAGNGGGDGEMGPAPVDAECGTLPCVAVYVAGSGNDASTGTRTMPLKTIAAGIAMAAQVNPPLDVYVQAGTYAETLQMKSGVTIYGGFDTTWTRVATATTEIDGASPAIPFDQISALTALDQVTVTSPNATAPSGSSVAIVVTSSSMIELRDVTVEPGTGAAGTDGVDGAIGAIGGGGGLGGDGVEHSGSIFCSSSPLPVGGAGGASSCGRTGGQGGSPGVNTGAGSTGGDGVVSAQSGGFGGASGQTGSPGAGGLAGGLGVAGTGGIQVGSFSGVMYQPAAGTNGTNGGDGNGGGGGVGSGGAGSVTVYGDK